jgi:hypothetical protein
MLRKGVKTLVLYLEDWQKRMIKNELNLDSVCDYYELQIEASANPIPKYGVPTDPSLKRMYFTDWQIREIRDETGKECEYIEISKILHNGMRYKPPTP